MRSGVSVWPSRTIDAVAQVVAGQSPPGDSYNMEGVGFPFFQGKAEFGATFPEVRKYTDAGTKFADAGDVLLSVRAPVGPTNVAPFHCAIGRGLMAVRAGSELDSRFLLWALRERSDFLASQAAGSTFAAVTGRQVRQLEIPVPPLAEQRRIVDILEDHLSRLGAADTALELGAARTSRLRSSATGRALKSSADWGRLGDHVERVEAGRSIGSSAPAAADEQWGIIKVSAMTWGEFRPSENKAVDDRFANLKFEIRSGDVLVSRANTSEYVGASVYVEDTPPRLMLSDKSLRVVPRSGVSARWLQFALSAPSIRREISTRATGTKDSMRNISQSQLLQIAFPRGDRAMQDSVVAELTALKEQSSLILNQVERNRSRGRALRRALLAAAFSGKLTGAASDSAVIEEIAG